jgi:hypothetical protein
VHLHAAVEQIVSRLRDAHVRLDPADQRLVAPVEVEAVRGDGRERDLVDRVDPVQVLGQLGHRRAEPLRVLLGDEHGQLEDARALDQGGGAGDDPFEVEHGRPERLLHVHDDQRGAAAVEHPGGDH